jgi:hypothetical protein
VEAIVPASTEAQTTSPAPSSDEVPASKSTPVDVGVGLAGLVLAGELPRPSVGLALSAVIAKPSWSFGLEGELALPAEREAAKGAVSASLLGGALVPCARVSVLFGCAVGRAGALQAEGSGVELPARKTAFYGTVGARVGVEVHVVPAVALFGAVEGLTPLTRIALELDGRETWVVPAIAARGMFGVRAYVSPRSR